MNHGLWLLTNQLYRPTTKSIAPALCFGFAVDGWNRVFENLLTHFRRISKKCYTRQTGAVLEGRLPDTGDAITNRDVCQAGAIEGGIPYTGDTIRNCDARQAGAVGEGFPSNTGDAVWDRDARQATAEQEGTLPDAGDHLTFDSRRDSERTRCLSIIACDGDRITFNLIL